MHRIPIFILIFFVGLFGAASFSSAKSNPYDIYNDGCVNQYDFLAFKAVFQGTTKTADYDNSGDADAKDLAYLARNYDLTCVPYTAPRAFPTAEGFGAQTPGGRGGIVIEVTNLNDSGLGSLRAALSATGARTIVFRVSGTIVVNDVINISNPYVTVAGQTAPGGGITLKNGPNNIWAPVRILTHDVIIRHIRFRPGASGAGLTDSVDGLSLVGQESSGGNTGANDVIIDHASVSWGTDENIEVSSLRTTIQNSIISEGLVNANHACNGSTTVVCPQGYGPVVFIGANKSTFYRNYLVNNTRRHPENVSGLLVDFVNNVTYNAGNETVRILDDYGVGAFLNYRDNLAKVGPETLASPNGKDDIIEVRDNTAALTGFYESGNIGQGYTSIVGGNSEPFRVVNPFAVDAYAQIDTMSASSLWNDIKNSVGASIPYRDSADARVIQYFDTNTGVHIDNPASVGGWPVLPTGTPYTDTDHDGMSDAWEISRNLNYLNAGDRNTDLDTDGYTNLEEFLNQLALDCKSCS